MSEIHHYRIEKSKDGRLVSVKRYDPEGYDKPAIISGTGTHMVERRDGDYVLASDYDALRAEVDEARRTAAFWKDEHLAGNRVIEQLRAEVEALRSENKHAKRCLDSLIEQRLPLVPIPDMPGWSRRATILHAHAMNRRLEAEVDRLRNPTDDMLVAGQEVWARGRIGALEDCEEARAIYLAMVAEAGEATP